MIHKQLLFPPHPHPSLLKRPPFPPQQHNNKMIQRIEPHPSSHPHPLPQFVAAKSLMLNPPKFIYTVSYVFKKNVLQNFF